MEASKLVKSPVTFRESDHTYWLAGRQLHGVTSTIIRTAYPGKYDGIPKAVLDNAASKGHAIHEEIEYHDRFGTMPDTPRLQRYEALKKANAMTVVENEYLVSDNETFASSIDIVMTDADDNICLVDTKTTYTLDKQSTALQLSVYRRFFEAQNPGLKVARLYALWLPQRDETIAELTELQPVDDAYLDDIIRQTLDALANPAAAEVAPAQEEEPLPDGYKDLEKAYDYWARIKAEADAHIDELKKQIMQTLIANDRKKVSTPLYTCSIVGETSKKVFDEKAFRAKHEDLYNEYLTKDKVTKSYITIKAKNNG